MLLYLVKILNLIYYILAVNHNEIIFTKFSSSCTKILNKEKIDRNLLNIGTNEINKNFSKNLNEYYSNKSQFVTKQEYLDTFKNILVNNSRLCANNQINITNNIHQYILMNFNFSYYGNEEYFWNLLLYCQFQSIANSYFNQININIIRQIISVYIVIEDSENISFGSRLRNSQIELIFNKIIQDNLNSSVNFYLFTNISDLRFYINDSLNRFNITEQRRFRSLFDVNLFQILENENQSQVGRCESVYVNRIIRMKINKFINTTSTAENIIPTYIAKRLFFDSECKHISWKSVEYDTSFKIRNKVFQLSSYYIDPISYRMRLMFYLYYSIRERNLYLPTTLSNINSTYDNIIATYIYLAYPFLYNNTLDLNTLTYRTLTKLFLHYPQLRNNNNGTVASKLQLKCLLELYEERLEKIITTNLSLTMIRDCDYFYMINTNNIHSLKSNDKLNIKSKLFDNQTKLIFDKINLTFTNTIPLKEFNLSNTTLGFYNKLLNLYDNKCSINNNNNNIDRYFSYILQKLSIFQLLPIVYWKTMCYLYKQIYSYYDFYSKLLSSDNLRDIHLFFNIYFKYQSLFNTTNTTSISSSLKTSDNQDIFDIISNIQYSYFFNEFIDCVEQLDLNVENHILTQLAVDLLLNYSRKNQICTEGIIDKLLYTELINQYNLNENLFNNSKIRIYKFKYLSSYYKYLQLLYNQTNVTYCHLDKIEQLDFNSLTCRIDDKLFRTKLILLLNISDLVLLEIYLIKCKCIFEYLINNHLFYIYNDNHYFNYIVNVCKLVQFDKLVIDYYKISSSINQLEIFYEIVINYYFLNVSTNNNISNSIKCSIHRLIYYIYHTYSNQNNLTNNTVLSILQCIHKIPLIITKYNNTLFTTTTTTSTTTTSTTTTTTLSTTISDKEMEQKTTKIYKDENEAIQTKSKKYKILYMTLGISGGIIIIALIIATIYFVKHKKNPTTKKELYTLSF